MWCILIFVIWAVGIPIVFWYFTYYTTEDAEIIILISFSWWAFLIMFGIGCIFELPDILRDRERARQRAQEEKGQTNAPTPKIEKLERDFARFAAWTVLPLWDAPDNVRWWIETGDEALCHEVSSDSAAFPSHAARAVTFASRRRNVWCAPQYQDPCTARSGAHYALLHALDAIRSPTPFQITAPYQKIARDAFNTLLLDQGLIDLARQLASVQGAITPAS